MKRTEFPGVANKLHVQKASRWSIDYALSVIRSVARAVVADHALGQEAAVKASLPRKNLADLRAMCAPGLEPHRQPNKDGPVPDGTLRATATRKVRTDFPSWSSPFPKRRKARP